MADQWAATGGGGSPASSRRHRAEREEQHAADEAEARRAVASEVDESEEEEEEEEENRLRGGVVDADDDYFRGSRELDVEERRAEEEGEKLIDEENAEDLVFGLQDDEREKEAFLAAGLDADAFDAALINDAALGEIDENLEEKARRAAERHLAARDREARRRAGKGRSYTRDIWAQLLEDDEEGASEMDRVLERVQQRQLRYYGAAAGGGGRGGTDQVNLQDFTEAKKLLSESNPALTSFGEQQQQAVDTLFRYFLYHFSLHAFKRSQGGSMLALGEDHEMETAAARGRTGGAAHRGEEEEGALYYLDRIRDMIRQDRCSLLVDTRHLLFFSEQLIRWLEAHPAAVLQVLGDAVAAEAQAAAPSLYSACSCSVVLTEWPYREELRSLRCSHLNTLIYVSGVVTRRSAVLPKMKLLYLKCAVCLASLSDLPIPLVEGSRNNPIPRKCLNCQSSRFVLDRVKTQYVDYQRLLLQETPASVPAGRVPRQREVLLQGELVDAVRPGEEVEVLGVYQMCCTGNVALNVRCGFPVLSTQIVANNILRRSDARLKDISDEDVAAIKAYSKHPHIRERIIASIAPALWGNKEVKTAIAYALFGGVPKGRAVAPVPPGGAGGGGIVGAASTGGGGAGGSHAAAAAAAGGAAGTGREAAAAAGAPLGGVSGGGQAAGALGGDPAAAGGAHLTGSNLLGTQGALTGGAAGGQHVIRGDINVLLLGDPGLGKSQALQYVARTFPRTVSTTGKGASAVGLTAGVRKDAQTGEWTLEGGALVLADEGICLIDEFDKMGERDRVSIHEAMEQQSISISKAGIVTTLRARCAVIAAANPKFGRYIPSYTFKENVDLSDPILSRFDLVAVLRDVPDADEDHFLAEYVLTNHQLSHPNITHLENYQQRMEELERIMVGNQAYEPLPQDILQKYIIYARAHCHPVLDPSLPALSAKISNFYARLRKRASASGGLPLTLRHVEAVLRIAEANAKMRLSPVVSGADVDYAIASLLDSFISSQKFSVQQRLSREFARYRALARGGGPTLAALLRRLMQQRLQRLLLLRPASSRAAGDLTSGGSGGIGMDTTGLQQAEVDQARRIKLSDFLKVAHQNKFAAYQVESWMASSHFSDQFGLLQEGDDRVIVSLNWHRDLPAAAASSDASTDAGASQRQQQHSQ